jgi:hypothetical protein
LYPANRAREIDAVLELADSSGARPVLYGVQEGYRIVGELARRKIAVLVDADWPAPKADGDPEVIPSLATLRFQDRAPTTPAALAKAGVQFALVSGAGKTGDYLSGIRKAVENGLSADDALRAVTLSPARILGIDRQLGSLERGKIANVVVSDKPLFDEKAKVTRVFVDGREIRLPKEDEKKPAGESAASPIDGTWSLTVRAPEGDVAMTVTLKLEDGALTGTYSGERGSGDLRGGSFADNNFEFTISAAAASGTEASDWTFYGSLDGTTMHGTVSSTIGKFEFSGSKPQ